MYLLTATILNKWTPDDVYGKLFNPMIHIWIQPPGSAVNGLGLSLYVFTYLSLVLTLLNQIVTVLDSQGCGISILVGNLLAVRQVNLNAILGYSSIAHFGYLLMFWLVWLSASLGV